MGTNYRDNCEKRRCSCGHNHYETLLKDDLVSFNIISLYIYKDLICDLRSSELRDHYHEDGYLVPISRRGDCFEAVFKLDT